MLGAAEEPKLRAEGVHDGEKISAICHFFTMALCFMLCFDGFIRKGTLNRIPEI